MGGDLFGGTGDDDLSAALPALGAEVDQPVGAFDYIEVMLNHQHGIAAVAQCFEHLNQLMDIGEVQPGGRFVENVECFAGRLFAQLGGELDALGLAAGERGGGLTEAKVAEPDFAQRAQFALHAGDRAEKFAGFIDRHGEHIGDAFAAVVHFKCFAVVTFAVALRAGHIDIRQKVHFDFEQTVAGAVLAAAALDVEAEPPRFIAAHLRGGQLREKIADNRKGAGIGDGVGSRGATDRRLIDHDYLVDLLNAEQFLVFSGTFLGTVEMAEEGAAQHIVGERAFAGAGNPGDAGEQSERNFHVHVFEIVFGRPFNFEEAVRCFGPFFWHFDLGFAPHVLRGQ